jgi:hypothetical protein
MAESVSCSIEPSSRRGATLPPTQLVVPTSIIGTLWTAFFGIDVRSLAAFRVALAVIVLCDLYFRSGSIGAFYTDAGLLSRAQAIEVSSNNPYFLSLHMISGGYWFQVGLFAVAAVFALMLLVGYRTRIAAVATWLLLCSLHTRNPQVLQGGDVLLRCLLFWGMLLPLGAAWSIDRARAPDSDPPVPRVVATIACMALLLQVCFLYIFTSALKSHADWRIDHTAVFYALSIDQLATPIGEWLLQYRGLLKALTASTILQESYGTYLAFAPGLLMLLVGRWRAVGTVTQWARLLTVVLFIGFHLGLASCMVLGPFPYICWAAWTPFLPSLFWDGLAARWQRRMPQGLAIWYDQDCGFCKASVRLIETFWMLPRHEVHACQEDAEILALMHSQNSWTVVTPDGTRHHRFAALAALMSYSPWLRPFSYPCRLGFIRHLGDRLYRYVASHRDGAGRALWFMAAQPLAVEPRAMAQLALDLLAAVLIYYVLLWNLRTLHAGNEFNTCRATRFFPTSDNWVLELPRLDQYWSMFSPMPLRDDGWYLAIATLADGSKVDLLTGLPPVDSSVTPPHLADRYQNERWRKYLMNLYTSDFVAWRMTYSHYLVDRWNREHAAIMGKTSVHFELVFWKKTNRYDGAPIMTRLSLAKIP